MWKHLNQNLLKVIIFEFNLINKNILLSVVLVNSTIQLDEQYTNKLCVLIMSINPFISLSF